MTNLFLFLFLIFFIPTHSQQSNSGTTEVVKVMTYNIWNGFDWGKDMTRKEKLINWVKSKKPDILALQELCAYSPELLAEDAKKWGHDFSVLLKTEGYSVGLTSNKPIQLIENIRTGMWHGMLHCTTYGIDVFVVHLSPADYEIRKREASIIREKVGKISNKKYIVLGDFNAHSPFDESTLKNNMSLLNKYLNNDGKPDNKYKNLLNESFDYSVISAVLGLPTIDICIKYVPPLERFSFPTPALIKGYGKTAQEIIENRERIDYILVSESLANACTEAFIFNAKSTEHLSDHFPVSATFKLQMQ